jgi:hypothetical protein
VPSSPPRCAAREGWALAHRAELNENWRRAREQLPLVRIPGLDDDYDVGTIRFTWAGFDEGDEVSGAGSAQLQADGSLQILLSFHLGDDAVLIARRP